MLDVQEDYTLSITHKMPRKADTHAKIFVALKDATSDYKEVEILTDASKKWASGSPLPPLVEVERACWKQGGYDWTFVCQHSQRL